MPKTLKSGSWFDPTVWDTIPTFSSLAEVNHDVTLDQDLTIAGINISGSLTLLSSADISIASSKNISVTGKLISSPGGSVVHSITFTGINENNFVGGGDIIVDSDIGLWVTGAGVLNLNGSLTGTWDSTNWRTDISTIISNAKKQSRNIIIGGTASGQSHLFIKSSSPQTIRYVKFQYMGPRKDANGDGVKELVTGRYACHFHHSEDGSRRSLVEGCIAANCNNHCFVPHGSHGITMRANMVFDAIETPFWYDIGHKTNDLVWEQNLVANVSFVERSQDQDSAGAPTFGVGGFLLGFGDSNQCNNNLVAFTSGDTREGGAYIWPEIRNDADPTLQLESPWTFKNNAAYGCPSGISVWQNNNHHHIVENFQAHACQTSILHGAYQNHYNYQGGYLNGGPIELRASSASTNRVRFEDMVIDANGGDYCVIANEGPLDGVSPIWFRNCNFENYRKKAIINQNPGPGLKLIDVVECGLPVTEYQVSNSALGGEVIRVQEGTQAWQITKSSTSSIKIFTPTSWNDGTGLTAGYYTPDFKTLLLRRVEPNINIFDITHPQIHYAVPASYAARWEGFIIPQTTENYTFICAAGGGVRLWIDGNLIIDQWDERYPGDIVSKPVALKVGVPYTIKLEYYNDDDRSECLLDWSTGTIKREAIPMDQLFPLGDVVTTTSTTTSSSSTAGTSTTSSTTTTTTTKAPMTTTTTSTTTRTTTKATTTTTSTTTTSSTTVAAPKVIIEILDNGTWRYK